MNKKKTFGFMLLAQSLSAFGDNAVYAVIMGTLLALVTGGTLTRKSSVLPRLSMPTASFCLTFYLRRISDSSPTGLLKRASL